MIAKPLPLQNVKELPPLTWGEMSYGFSHGYFGWKTAVDLATKKVEEGDSEAEALDLAMVDKEDAWKTGDILASLATKETTARPAAQEVWLFIFLRWLYEHREEFRDPLMEMEEVYADFDYPEAMKGFVRFLPPSDGYRPDLHTQEENVQRLYQKWRGLPGRCEPPVLQVSHRSSFRRRPCCVWEARRRVDALLGVTGSSPRLWPR